MARMFAALARLGKLSYDCKGSPSPSRSRNPRKDSIVCPNHRRKSARDRRYLGPKSRITFVPPILVHFPPVDTPTQTSVYWVPGPV